MLWLNPSALFALASVAAPVLIHILVQRRAERFPFPTLRFLQPTRLASVRRHVLEDVVLLAVRVALFAVAVAALAGPLLVTSARQQAWNRRVARAVVVDGAAAGIADVAGVARGFPPSLKLRRTAEALAEAGQPRDRDPERAALQWTFTTASLPDGLRRATLWLDTVPPARREIVVVSPFPIGSIAEADVAAIPIGIGVSFERSGALPGTRAMAAGRLLTSRGVRAREVTLEGGETSVRDTAVGEPMVWPIDVVSSKADQPAIDAAVAAVLSQRVWAAPPDRRARLVLVEPKPVGEDGRPAGGDGRPAIDGLSDASPIRQPWMADAAARIARDVDLRAAARVTEGLSDPTFRSAPWQLLASAADGRPLAAAAASANRLVVASAGRASDVATPVMLRAMTNAIAAVSDLQRAEVLPIADTMLRQWSRPASPAAPRIETIEQDDRRWLWLAALFLLGLETWIRRAPRSDEASGAHEEAARVA